MIDYKHDPHLTGIAKALRKSMTKEERHLWYDFLRDYPVRVLRQKVIDEYVVDFYCSGAKLVIELDGSQHFEPENLRKDQIRQQHLKSRGLAVIRIPNNEVNHNYQGTCEYIDRCIQERMERPPCERGLARRQP